MSYENVESDPSFYHYTISLDSELKSPTVHVIREVYEGENAHETFELELDKALYAKADFIIIEPFRLGEETGRWIAVGNCLHKTAIISGVASVAAGLIWRGRLMFCTSFCALSIFCTSLYTISWSYDPCVKYQVEKNPKNLSKVPNVNDFSSPIVLVYKSNTYATLSHRIVTLLAGSYCAWRIYQILK
ncbi:transmembrane protein 11 homolog, mitochondrial isoform X2 [Uranotaenia lowii]|uniref:transmembrane protein 11 homolog, mitochondrial isoform X2 n=1 Tax=Uranotaenia lowii TaxID=190385 RepID=UPI0024786E48|nr:transmembrane protein 11 homolog, mitochondrial isoform X2 [Uranotaenia lowii]